VNVLAIDQGTSSTKALVVSAAARVLAAAEVPVHPVACGAGGVEQDPEELWTSIVAAGREALVRAREPVAAVGLANQGETVLVWDPATGRPLSRALSWQDRRATEVCTRLASRAARLQALTGLPLDPYFAAPKITWLREHVSTDGVATTSDTWLLHRLTGAFVTDATTASRTLLLDLDRRAWSPEACALFGIDAGTLAPIVGCAQPIGETSAFGPPLPICGLAVDQQAALFAEGCLEEGDAKCTFGTGAFLLVTAGASPRRSRAGLVGSIAWRLADADTFCLDGQVYTAGAALGWLRDLGLLAAIEDLDGEAGRGAVGAPDGTGAGGVTFVPALAGLGAPFWRPEARGAFVGLSLATGRSDLLRAVIEGIAAQVAVLAEAAGTDLGRPLTRLRVDGGLTRSRLLMQTQADLLQIPIDVYPSPHATALGIAALARIGAGLAASPADAIASWSPSASYAPQIGRAEADGRLGRWRRAADAAIGFA
jgi:glycerol kinase